jgi:hypothetical protein
VSVDHDTPADVRVESAETGDQGWYRGIEDGRAVVTFDDDPTGYDLVSPNMLEVIDR